MKKLASIFILLLPSLAMAEVWDGFYVGIGAGESQVDYTYAPAGTVNDEGVINSPQTNVSEASQQNLYGLRLGHHWRFTNWVTGVELAFLDLNMDEKHHESRDDSFFRSQGNYNYYIDQSTNQITLNGVGLLRGKLGYLIKPNLLLYGIAGVAYYKPKQRESAYIKRGYTTLKPNDYNIREYEVTHKPDADTGKQYVDTILAGFCCPGPHRWSPPNGEEPLSLARLPNTLRRS